MRIIVSALAIMAAIIAWQHHSKVTDDYENRIEQLEQRIAHTSFIQKNERAIRDDLEKNTSEYSKKLEESYIEKDSLARDLADANKRLRIKAVCPGGSGTVDGAGASTHSAELAGDARRAYLDHRRAVIEAEAWMVSCRDALVDLEERLKNR